MNQISYLKACVLLALLFCIQSVVLAANNRYPGCENLLHSSNDSISQYAFILTVNINGKSLPGFYDASFILGAHQRLILELQAWKKMNLALQESGENIGTDKRGFALETISGLTYTLDCARQNLTISAPSAAFIVQEYNIKTSDSIKNLLLTEFGGYINYDLNYIWLPNLDETVIGTNFNSVFFTPLGSFVHQFIYNESDYFTGYGRVSTYFQKDFNDRNRTLILGDSTTSDGTWSRPVFFAGIKLSSNYSLQPNYITYPQLSLRGAAALPSTVDVLLDGEAVLNQLNVDSGYFMLDNLPLKSGVRSLDLILRDQYGHEYNMSSSYYLSTSLLRPGLTDFSLELGQIRQSLDQYSYRYTQPFISHSLRKGFSKTLTLGMREELSHDRQAVGFSFDQSFFNQGLLSAAFAWSRQTDQISPKLGFKNILGFERNSQYFNFNIRNEYADENFRPFGYVNGEILNKNLTIINFGTSLFQNITFNGSFISRSAWNTVTNNFVNCIISSRLTDGVYGNLNLSQSIDVSDDWYIGAYISANLSAAQHLQVSQRYSKSAGNISQLSYQDSRDSEWQKSIDLFQQQETGSRVNVTHLGQNRRSTIEAYALGDSQNLRLSTSGSYVFFYDALLAAPPLYTGSFALVKAGDLPGLDIYHNNQKVAQTNKNGIAVLANIYPNQSNTISIEPNDVPIEYSADAYSENIAVSRLSGNLVDFHLKKGNSLLMNLKLDNGEDVPLGSKVYLYNAQREYYIIGKNGVLYIPQAPEVLKGRAVWQGGSCRILMWYNSQEINSQNKPSYVCRRVSWDRSVNQ